MILERYLALEVAKPVAGILGMLVALFASYSAAAILGDAVNELLPLPMVLGMVGLKVLISLEVLIPISLFLSVVLTFSRLQAGSELTAMFAAGVSPGRLRLIVFVVAGSLAVLVGGLSILVRPMAYQKLHSLSRQAAASIDLNGLQAGRFYIGQDGDRMIHVARREGRAGPARDVFVRTADGNGVEIITGKLAYLLPKRAGDIAPEAFLSEAHIYKIDDAPDQDKIVTARGLVLNPNLMVGPANYSPLEISSVALARSAGARDVAELQWRLSTPVSTILLAMLGILLSGTAARQGQFAKVGAAILAYTGYYLAINAARTWVQHGAVAAVPGIWWVPCLLALVVVFGFYRSDFAGAARRAAA